MKTENYICDIAVCTEEAYYKGSPLQAIFTTEQTEGRGVEPYLSMEKVDICKGCMSKIVKGNYVWANGAQGSNTYYFK